MYGRPKRFELQIITRLKWCRRNKERISYEALVNLIVRKNVVLSREEKTVKGEVKYGINNLIKKNRIEDNKGYLELVPQKRSLKYPLNKYPIKEAIRLTILAYFERENKKIETTPIKRPLKEFDCRRTALLIKKSALINFISKQRRDFDIEIVNQVINEMIDDETIFSDDPNQQESDYELSANYYGNDARLQLNGMKNMIV